MIVLILERVPPSLRGELSRWLIEPKTGVFIGKLSAMVRDKLWEKCINSAKAGSVVMVWNYNNEQGFQIKSHGINARSIVDLDGLILIKKLK